MQDAQPSLRHYLHVLRRQGWLIVRLHVSSQPDSSVLQVSYRGHDKRASVRILREVGIVFTNLVKRRLGAGTTTGTNGQPNVAAVTTSVFDPAHLEPGRVSPRPVRNLAFTGSLALLLGLVLAFVRESLDDRIRTRREAEDWFGAPVMGSLPKGVRGRSVPELVSNRRGRRDQATEALDLLRANVQFAQSGPEGGTIVVTS